MPIGAVFFIAFAIAVAGRFNCFLYIFPLVRRIKLFYQLAFATAVAGRYSLSRYARE